MPQTSSEFLREGPPQLPVELCGCGCGKPLEKNDPLGPYWVGTGKNRKLINEECFFKKIGEENR